MLSNLPSTQEICQTGPGDDAAVLHDGTVITTDSLVESVHWDNRLSSRDVGWKSIAVSISDLAAMGAMPIWATCSLSIPLESSMDWIQGFAAGVTEACVKFQLTLVGGDTTRSPGPKFINITMGGRPVASPITRDKAVLGDEIWVTGILGLAAAGYTESHPFDAALIALRQPHPPLHFALDAAKEGLLHAMMDVSDGLASDLPKLCHSSGVGAVLQPERFPSHAELDQLANVDALRFAGGDDFQLLFTAPKRSHARLRQLATTHQIVLSDIGRVTEPPNVTIENQVWPLAPWSHFTAEKVCS